MPYWKRSFFEVIGQHFGGLVSISSQTINLVDCLAVVIKVEENICGFILVEIEIKDGNIRKIFLHFGDIVALDRSTTINFNHCILSIEVFSNSVYKRINLVMEDKGFTSTNKDDLMVGVHGLKHSESA